MKAMLSILIFISFFTSARADDLPNKAAGQADSSVECAWALGDLPSFAVNRFNGRIQLKDGQKLFLRIDRPTRGPVKQWHFLIHGLLDSHRAFDKVSEHLLRNHHGVVRLDLRGAASSIDPGDDSLAPDTIPYTQHLRDLTEVLEILRDRFGIEKPQVSGHSLGGGLALALFTQPDILELAAPRVIIAAPYVYRLDYYLLEKLNPYRFMPGSSLSMFDKMFPSMMRSGNEFMSDMLKDPSLRVAFNSFFAEILSDRKIAYAGNDFEKWRNRHVKSAIAMMKGLRELNALEAIADIPDAVDVVLFYGTDDNVTEPALARKLSRQVKRRGGKVYVVSSGHMITDDVPEEFADVLMGRVPAAAATAD